MVGCEDSQRAPKAVQYDQAVNNEMWEMCAESPPNLCNFKQFCMYVRRRLTTHNCASRCSQSFFCIAFTNAKRFTGTLETSCGPVAPAVQIWSLQALFNANFTTVVTTVSQSFKQVPSARVAPGVQQGLWLGVRCCHALASLAPGSSVPLTTNLVGPPELPVTALHHWGGGLRPPPDPPAP